MEKEGPPPAYNDQLEASGNTQQPVQTEPVKGTPADPLMQPPGYPIQQQPGYYQATPGYQQQPYGGGYPQQYGYAGNVMMAAPAPAQYVGPPPENHSVLAWLTCLCCCWPLGLISIIKSMEVNNSLARGDYLSARSASDMAKKFGYAALGFGIFGYLCTGIYLIIYFLVIWPSLTENYN